jgi:hypothetical protein
MANGKTQRKRPSKKSSTRSNRKPAMMHGGKNYKGVELKYGDKLVPCEICGSNNYYHRDATMGRSKAASLLYTPKIGSLSVFSLFCNTCGLARILKKENAFDQKSTKFEIRPLSNINSIEDKISFPFRPMKF